MSAWIPPSAVVLCVCATGCDMVPPVKMVKRTAFPEPIPVRNALADVCNVHISVTKCEPLWRPVPQWCAAWSNTLNNTDLVLLHPPFSGEPQQSHDVCVDSPLRCGALRVRYRL